VKRKQEKKASDKTQTERQIKLFLDLAFSGGNFEILGKKEYFPPQKETKSEKFRRIEV